MAENVEEICETIAVACRILGNLELTTAALGHVSYRSEQGDMMYIKGKGVDEVGLRYTTSDDVLLVDFEANKVSGPDGLQPPSESFLHIWLYKLNPAVKSVIHVHPEHPVLLTICEQEIIPITGSGARLAIGGIPTYPRSVTIASHALGEEFARCMGDRPVALMKGHGIAVAASGIEEATLSAITFNELATMTYKANLLGKPTAISEEDIAWYRRPPEEHRARGSAGGREGTLATWRYYVRLAGALSG